jgi:hypothetical protein
MTAEIINLRRARKAKARAEREQQAASRRVAFGRTKAERTESAAIRRIEDARLEGSRRDAGQPEAGDEVEEGDPR